MSVAIEPSVVDTCTNLVANLEQRLDQTVTDEAASLTDVAEEFYRALAPLARVQVSCWERDNITFTTTVGAAVSDDPSEVVKYPIDGEHAIGLGLWLNRDCSALDERCITETTKSAARLLSQMIARNRIESATRLQNELQQLHEQYPTLNPDQRAQRCAQLIAQAACFDRASILQRRGSRFQLLASSATTIVDRGSAKVRAMEETAYRLNDRFVESDPLQLRRDDPNDADVWFADDAQSVHAYRLANGKFLVFGEATTANRPWLLAMFWIAMEGLLNRLSDRIGTSTTGRPKRRLIIGLSLAATCIFMAFTPAKIRVPASGHLTPLVQKSVYAPTDGVITAVFFDPGTRVHAGDPLFEMASHELALREAEVLGAILSAREQLAVTIARRGDREQNSTHVDRRVIEVRIEQLEKQLAVLNRRKEELTVRSPIDGIATVLLDDDSTSLTNGRPVQAGQGIVRVLEPESGYEIRLEIDDSDTGYVVRAKAKSKTPLSCTYRHPSEPTRTHQATLQRLADSVHLNESGQRVLGATLKPEITGHLGVAESGVMGWIESESAPVGFVLFRKVVQTLRIHGWL